MKIDDTPVADYPFEDAGKTSLKDCYYLEGNPKVSLDTHLSKFYSKSEIKRLKKQKSITTAKDDLGNKWVKVGKNLFIVCKGYSQIAMLAHVWWEYHNQLKPKSMKWV